MSAFGRLSDASVIPLSTVDPAAPLDELEPLAALIDEEVRIVAIGESAHAAHEYYALRHRLVRFLVERMNFTALVWEAGFSEAFAVDNYIQGGPQDRDRTLIDGMTMHMGRCDEMGELVDWLRAHNAASARPVRFYGLDLPATLEPALAEVGPYVESVDPGFGTRLTRLRELAASFGHVATPGDETKLTIAGPATLRQYLAMSVAERNELTGLLADLGARFDSLRRSYIERSDATRHDVARQHVRVAAQLDVQLRAVAALMAGDAAACEGNIRDRTMADTVNWILGREDRIIVLAHNGHIQKTPIATPAGTAAAVDTVGVHLADRFGAQYVAIGTTCGGGEMIAMRTVFGTDGSYDSELYLRQMPPAEADTIDALLDTSIHGIGLVDLRKLDPDSAAAVDSAQRMRMQDQVMNVDIRRAFDMLIHVPRISPWTSSVNATLPDERDLSKD